MFFFPSLDLKESSVITQYLQIVPQVLSLSAFLGMTSMGKRWMCFNWRTSFSMSGMAFPVN